MTEKARTTFRDSFDKGHKCKLCPETVIDQSLPAAERRRKAEAAYTAHMTRLSHRRAVIRRQAVAIVEAAIDAAAEAEAELARLDNAV
jgi:hypothetical protein